LNWNALLSAFGLIFVAELGDKTQLAVVTQTCKFRRPWAVFAGASLALTGVTAIGAAGGQVLAQFIPQATLRIVAALAFVLMGLLVGREAYRAGRRLSSALVCEADLDEAECDSDSGWDWRAFGATFGLLFVAELGDKTQLAVLGLAGQYSAPLMVFAGGSLALVLVTALGVVGGEGVSRLIPERVLLWVSAVAFVVMGILMGFQVI
jgi:putative Ca2+/H+ antiporter (TMEM165/GDT1 family)